MNYHAFESPDDGGEHGRRDQPETIQEAQRARTFGEAGRCQEAASRRKVTECNRLHFAAASEHLGKATAILLWTDDGEAASNGRIYRVERKSDQLLPLNWRAYWDGRCLGDFPSYYVAQLRARSQKHAPRSRSRPKSGSLCSRHAGPVILGLVAGCTRSRLQPTLTRSTPVGA